MSCITFTFITCPLVTCVLHVLYYIYLCVAYPVFLPVPGAVGPPVGGWGVVAAADGQFDACTTSEGALGPVRPRPPVAGHRRRTFPHSHALTPGTPLLHRGTLPLTNAILFTQSLSLLLFIRCHLPPPTIITHPLPLLSLTPSHYYHSSSPTIITHPLLLLSLILSHYYHSPSPTIITHPFPLLSLTLSHYYHSPPALRGSSEDESNYCTGLFYGCTMVVTC